MVHGSNIFLFQAVYQMTISPEEDPEHSVALAMQRVFYDLSHSEKVSRHLDGIYVTHD